MALEARRTASQMETAVRVNLDEATAAFWTQANLWSILTRSAHAVATEMRKLRSDYFLRSMASGDSSETIYSETYAPSSLAIVAGTSTYTLPPDLLELKLIEVTTSGYEATTFTHRDLADPRTRAVRMLMTTNQAPGNGFFFDVVGERTLEISPKSDTALALRIWYVSSAIIRTVTTDAAKQDFDATTDTLIMPFPGYIAVEEVATMRALLRDRDPLAGAYAAMADASVARLFGSNARISQDPEVVYGLFE